MTPQDLLTAGKPTVAHIRTSGCKRLVRVPDRTRKALQAKPLPGVLMLCLSFGKYCIMMESDLTVHTSCHCPVKKDQFPMRPLTKVFMVSKDCIDEPFADEEGDDLINRGKVDEQGLDLSRAISQSDAPPDGNEARTSPLEVNQQQLAANHEECLG